VLAQAGIQRSQARYGGDGVQIEDVIPPTTKKITPSHPQVLRLRKIFFEGVAASGQIPMSNLAGIVLPPL
jgi:hypothetical protein